MVVRWCFSFWLRVHRDSGRGVPKLSLWLQHRYVHDLLQQCFLSLVQACLPRRRTRARLAADLDARYSCADRGANRRRKDVIFGAWSAMSERSVFTARQWWRLTHTLERFHRRRRLWSVVTTAKAGSSRKARTFQCERIRLVWKMDTVFRAWRAVGERSRIWARASALDEARCEQCAVLFGRSWWRLLGRGCLAAWSAIAQNARNMQAAHRAVACFPTLRAWHARAMRSKRRSPLLFWNLSMMAQSRALRCFSAWLGAVSKATVIAASAQVEHFRARCFLWKSSLEARLRVWGLFLLWFVEVERVKARMAIEQPMVVERSTQLT